MYIAMLIPSQTAYNCCTRRLRHRMSTCLLAYFFFLPPPFFFPPPPPPSPRLRRCVVSSLTGLTLFSKICFTLRSVNLLFSRRKISSFFSESFPISFGRSASKLFAAQNSFISASSPTPGGSVSSSLSSTDSTRRRVLVSSSMSRSLSLFCDARMDSRPVSGAIGASDSSLFAVTLSTSSLVHFAISTGSSFKQFASASIAFNSVKYPSSGGNVSRLLWLTISSVRLIRLPSPDGSDTSDGLGSRSRKILSVPHFHSVASGRIGASATSSFSRATFNSVAMDSSAVLTSSHCDSDAASACAASTRSLSSNLAFFASMLASSISFDAAARFAFDASMSSRLRCNANVSWGVSSSSRSHSSIMCTTFSRLLRSAC
eukprot:m.15968 g.15968  ORF g.15968 m.15968 type:complete len:373 (-) comp10846_c0_seq2:353-1471(-)